MPVRKIAAIASPMRKRRANIETMDGRRNQCGKDFAYVLHSEH